MLPTEFLSQIADKYGLSSEQTEVFLLKFGSDKSNKEIMVACHMPEGTLNHHMGKVYQKFSIAGSGTGKAAKLLSFLTGEYQKYKPSSVSSSGASKDELEETTAKKRVVVDEAIPVVPVWQGRDELLEDLLERLLQSENRLKVLALVGQGGIGKTSLVVKLLEALGVDLAGKSFVEKERTPLTPLNKGRTPLTPLVKGRTPLTPLVKGTTPLTPLNKGGSLWGECPYECVMYFKAQEGSSFDDVAEFLLRKGLGSETAESLKDASEKIAKIIEGLEKTRCLVVLDNLESILHPAKGADDAGEMSAPKAHRAISADWGKLLNALVYQQHRSQTILTSREVPADLADRRYEGAEPDSELVWIETLRGVKTEAGVEILRQRQLKDTEADLLWVSERVEGHVFLLTQLAAVGKGKPGYLRKHPELVTKKAEPILREQLARQSEVARDLLRRMCVLRAGIDIRGLTFLRLYRDDEEEFGRFSMAAVMEEPAELMDEEINETEAILERLIDSSLVQCRYDEEKCEEFYDLHRVIVEFLQAEYKDELPNLLNSVYQFYRTGKNVENPQALEDLRPVLEAQHFAFQLGKYSEAWSLLKWNIEDYLEPWGNWSLLKDLYEQILPHVDDDDRPYCLRAIGCIHRDCGNWNEAENYFQDALSLSQEQDSKSGIATSLGLLGDIERHRGNWDEAQRLYRQSLELMTQLGDRSGMATSWGVFGDIERNRGNWDEAERLFRQCLEIETQLGDRSGMASCWGMLGDIECNRSNWDEAERLYRQALELRTQLGDRSGMATSIGCLGEIEMLRGNLEAAEPLIKDALATLQELGSTQKVAEAYYDLARLERRRTNTELAQQHYNTAHQIFQQLGAAKDLEKIEQEWKQNF